MEEIERSSSEGQHAVSCSGGSIGCQTLLGGLDTQTDTGPRNHDQ